MTLIIGARLAMDVLLSASNAVLATALLDERGWRSLVPPLLMCMLVARLGSLPSPQTPLLAFASAACGFLLLARGPHLRSLRLAAVVICSLATAIGQLLTRVWPVAGPP